MSLIYRPRPVANSSTVAMNPKKQVTTGGAQAPAKKGSKNMVKSTGIKSMGDKHVKMGKPSLRSVPKAAVNAGFAGKNSTGKLRSVPKSATSPKFAGKA